MSALTSLLVRDRVVPISKIEEALQSQVLTGGDIDTVLLEMNAVPEDVLSAYRAALFGLLPATREELMRAPHDAVRVLTRDIAQRANIVPILFEGSSLVVAVAEPLSAETSQRLQELLKCELTMRVVTQPRLAAALHHYYGTDIDGRTRRLVDALRKRDPGIIPYVRPPSPALKPSLQSGARLGPERRDDADMGAPIPVSIPAAPQFKLSEPSLRFQNEAASAGRWQSAVTTQPLGSSNVKVGAGAPPEAGVDTTPRHEHATPSRPAPSFSPLSRSTTVPPSGLTPRVARGARGPISRERAVELLSYCESRDDVLFVLLRYVQQFFDFVSIFSAGKEGYRGRLAHGVGLSPELMEHVVVPLDSQGLLGLAARDKGPRVGDLSACDEERAAAALLGRPSGQPGIAVPILLRNRTVLLVYADRDGEGLMAEDADVILGVGAEVAATLKRLIVQRKTLGGPGSAPPPGTSSPPSGEGAPPATGASPSGGSVSSAPAVDSVSSELEPSPSEEPGPASASSATSEPAPAEVAPGPSATGTSDAGLTAVDLDAMVQAPAQFDFPSGKSATGQASKRAQRDAMRSQFPGVPRTAPPPPVQNTTKLWQGASSGSYSYSAPGGLASETVRTLPDPAETDAEVPLNQQGEAAGSAALRLSLVGDGAVPSVIIDMGDQVTVLVEALADAELGEEAQQVDALLELGEGVLPVLLQHFPGRLWVERASLAVGEYPAGRDVSAIARAIASFGDRSAPYVASLVSNGEGDAVFYGLLLAGDLTHGDLLDPLARRAFDPDESIRTLALSLLRARAHLPRYPIILRALSDLASRPGRDPRRQRLALEALRTLRDPRTARSLLERMTDADAVVVNLAHSALVELTAQDFGHAHRKWEAWLEQHHTEHRVEWLIDSLTHADAAIRAIAADELQAVSQLYLGYHPSLSKKDRELIQRKYYDWWRREGLAALT